MWQIPFVASDRMNGLCPSGFPLQLNFTYDLLHSGGPFFYSRRGYEQSVAPKSRTPAAREQLVR
jgi:hypothetical protein